MESMSDLYRAIKIHVFAGRLRCRLKLWVNIFSRGKSALDYEQLLSGLRSSTRELMEGFLNVVQTMNFNSSLDGRSVIRRIGGLNTSKLREVVAKPSITLAAIDGSCANRDIGGVVFVASASASLMYELVFSGSLWVEKWPERGYEYSLVLPLLGLQSEHSSEEDAAYRFDMLAMTMMKMLEHFAVIDSLELADAVLIDGSLSTEYYTSILRTLESRLYTRSKLVGLKTSLGSIDEYDLFINLYRGLDFLPTRGREECPMSLIFEAEKNNGNLCLDSIPQKNVETLEEIASTYPSKISLQNGRLELSEEALKSWKKVLEVVEKFKSLVGQIGGSSAPRIARLGLNDMNLLRAYTLLEMLHKASSLQKLLVGVAKDSTSISLQQFLLGGRGEASNLPDKLALELYSSLKEPTLLGEPWCTLEYDPFKNTQLTSWLPNIPETVSRFYTQLFVKEDVRSDVVVCERLSRRLPAKNTSSVASDEKDWEFTIQLLLALSQQTHSIPEALGHIYPLFEVDKHVKHMLHEVLGAIDGFGVLLQAEPAYREYLSIIKPFRKKRGEFERGRRGAQWRH